MTSFWQRARELVRLRTRLRKGYRRLRHHVRPRARIRKASRSLRAAAATASQPLRLRLRGYRARTVSRRRRRRIGDLDGLPNARRDRDLVPPRDTRELLQDGAGAQPPPVDVIVCVRDALEDVHRCLASILERSDRPLRLIVVDDGSAEPTAEYLARFAELNPAVDLRRNDGPRHGYTVAANIGLRASEAEHVVLLNSDTVVTRGWLARLLAVFEANDEIGIVGPLSNAASHQSVPAVREAGEWAVNELPDWLTDDAMAAVIARLPGEDAIPVPFVNGFCYCISRRVIDAVGSFDEERFADGYSEENDYSRRAADAGFSLAVATRAYVRHAKSRSYGRDGRRELAKRNYQRFLEKHGEDQIRDLVADIEANERLAALRGSIEAAIRSPEAAVAHLPLIRVTFVLPGVARGGSGGSHSIYQEVAAMRSLGIPARIAVAGTASGRVAAVYRESDELFVTYRDDAELAALVDGDDVVVATHFKSASAVARAVQAGSVGLGAYYVQDYEPLFVPDGSPDAAEASASYRVIPDAVLFAKTDWIRATLAEFEDIPAAKVEPSLDRTIFHTEGRVERDGHRPHIIAMLRPRTPRRAPRETLDVLARVAASYGSEVRMTTFGCRQDELKTLGVIPPGVEHRGLLSREQVADLMRTADVFLDCSWYQAFGRTSLEAMACGATSVLPKIGGVTEFAEHGVNCLLADTLSRADTYAALVRLLDDGRLLRGLQSAATGTASRYSATRAALSEYTLFCHALSARSGAAYQIPSSIAPT